MKANELRIGNLITRKNKVLKVCIIQPDKILVSGYSWGKYFKCDDLEPIPLTEEWLFKFGFKKYKKQSTFCRPEYRKKLRNSWNSYICFHFVDGWELPYSCDIKELPSDVYDIRKNHSSFPVQNLKINHVHQLQNLYFALTGEELVEQP